MSIATRQGDDGTTSLLYGQRVPKDHPQIEAVGALDELNAALGLAKATASAEGARARLIPIQQDLVALMGELACAETDAERYARSKFRQLAETDLARLDAAIAELEATPRDLRGWATPGANLPAATLDLARTTARRAERRVIALAAHGRHVRPLIGQYLNRVSDLLWLLAREAEAS